MSADYKIVRYHWRGLSGNWYHALYRRGRFFWRHVRSSPDEDVLMSEIKKRAIQRQRSVSYYDADGNSVSQHP